MKVKDVATMHDIEAQNFSWTLVVTRRKLGNKNSNKLDEKHV